MGERRTELSAEERDRQVAQGEAGSIIEHLWRQEQWLRRLAGEAVADTKNQGCSESVREKEPMYPRLPFTR